MSAIGGKEIIEAIAACTHLTKQQRDDIQVHAALHINVGEMIVIQSLNDREKFIIKLLARIDYEENKEDRTPESKVDALRRHCAQASIRVEQHVMKSIVAQADLSSRLTHCQDSADFILLYQDAASRLGTSTRLALIAVDLNRNIVIDRIFLAAHSSSSNFYYAYEHGLPYLLKFAKQPEAIAALHREAAAYDHVKQSLAKLESNEAERQKNIDLYRVLSQGFPFLVPVELIQLIDSRSQSSCKPQILLALKMPVFVGTLQSCPSDVRLAELYANAGKAVSAAMTVLHSVGFVHCDIKPSSIFIDSNGRCLLGDYDAVVKIGQPVSRSSPNYLPEPFHSQFKPPQPPFPQPPTPSTLVASPAVDFAMLSCTLLSGLKLPFGSQVQLESLIQQLTTSLQQDKAKPVTQVMKSIQSFQEKIIEQLQECAIKMKE